MSFKMCSFKGKSREFHNIWHYEIYNAIYMAMPFKYFENGTIYFIFAYMRFVQQKYKHKYKTLLILANIKSYFLTKYIKIVTRKSQEPSQKNSNLQAY